jgi:superfamily I DNA/RNA helicase
MSIRHLINDDGSPFDDDELDALAVGMEALDIDARRALRDANAASVANHLAHEMLIVAGPGTGKSTLFKQRIKFWLDQDSRATILALSFVRKLVADLQSDIQNDPTLTDDQKRQVDVFTLHKYARSVVEQNHGTKVWKFTPHFRIIGQSWKDVVWGDVLLESGQQDRDQYSWKAFGKQLHDERFDESDEWKRLKSAYFALCQFYNAAGFSDMILRAKDALAEKPDLNSHQFFIFDEYQDFNESEETLLNQITAKAKATLIVGDDDQVLYETLKSGKASLIRSIYADTTIVNAMLPFCGRCDFHITCAAGHFIEQKADPDCIRKIYLPMSDPATTRKVQVVACAAPTAAVDYIRKFIETHKDHIEKRKQELAAGTAKDAFLLILSPSRAVDFYRPNGARDELLKLIAPYQQETKEFPEDYYKVLNYYSLDRFPTNNFTFRKVLHYEGIDATELEALLQACLPSRTPFCQIDNERIKVSLATAKAVRETLDSNDTVAQKVDALSNHIELDDPKLLLRYLSKAAIDDEKVRAVEHQEEEEAELEEIEVKQMSAIEMMTIVGSKGLSADHVIIIGFDNVNMNYVTANAFFVAMTRARRSLHIITALKAGGAAHPHDFLDSLPDTNLEFSKYTKGERVQTGFGSRAAFRDYLRYLNRQRRRR